MAVVQITASAARELERARRWWHANRDKAPLAFDEDVDGLLRVLADRPRLIGRAVAGRIGVRRVQLPRIRYYAFFRITDDETCVVLLAVRHTSRSGEPRL